VPEASAGSVVEATLERITFASAETGYTVARVDPGWAVTALTGNGQRHAQAPQDRSHRLDTYPSAQMSQAIWLAPLAVGPAHEGSRLTRWRSRRPSP
jgi:hypothetical protein